MRRDARESRFPGTSLSGNSSSARKSLMAACARRGHRRAARRASEGEDQKHLSGPPPIPFTLVSILITASLPSLPMPFKRTVPSSVFWAKSNRYDAFWRDNPTERSWVSVRCAMLGVQALVGQQPFSLPRIVLAAAVETCWEIIALARTPNRCTSGQSVKGPTALIRRHMTGSACGGGRDRSWRMPASSLLPN